MDGTILRFTLAGSGSDQELEEPAAVADAIDASVDDLAQQIDDLI